MLMMHAQSAMLPPRNLHLICDSQIAFPRFLARQPGRHWKEDWTRMFYALSTGSCFV
jgi:hypothetical protein